MPMSFSSMVSTAGICDSRSSPLNEMFSLRPSVLLSSILYSKPAFSKGEEELFSGTLREKQKEDEQKLQKELQKKMHKAAAELNFEEAAQLRDRMLEVKKMLLDME